MEQKINLDRLEQAEALFGSFDENVRLIEKEFGVALVVRDSELKITGDDPEAVDKATRTVQSLLTLIGSGENLTEQNVRYCIRMVTEGKVTAVTGEEVSIDAHSICVHGDNPSAVEFVKNIRAKLEAEGVTIAPIADIV